MPDDFELTRFTGWRHLDENRAEILRQGQFAYHLWRNKVADTYDWELPEEIDPRGYLTVHDQGNVGSCQGQSLADTCEAAHFLETGEVVELSRAYSYLASQERDGLLGRDNGSTLSAGSDVAMNGIPLESDFGYTANYSSILNEYRSRKSELASKASDWQFHGAVPLSSYSDILRFLQTRSGAVHIGIMWTLPDAWKQESYRYSQTGGHAVVLCGYLQIQGWSEPGILLKNSWSERWGDKGYCVCSSQCIEQMTRGGWNVFVGRSKPVTPKPKWKVDI